VRERLSRIADLLVLVSVPSFLGWSLAGDASGTLSRSFDAIAFGAVSLATIIEQGRAATRSTNARDRLGWWLLVAAAFSRFLYGRLWSVYVAFDMGVGRPEWLTPLSVAHLVLLPPALLLFVSRHWSGRDRDRYLLDVASVVVGSAVLTWLFAIAPLLRSPTLADAALIDQLFTLSDGITLILAAWLHLRAADPLVRRFAVWLLAAYGLRLITDLGFWEGGFEGSYVPGGFTDALWFLGWVLTWAGAREAARGGGAEGAEVDAAIRYRSGSVPFVFLLSAGVAFFAKLALGDLDDLVVAALGGSIVSALLVARQWVEVSERDAAATQLRQEGVRYRALLHHAFDAVVMIDGDGYVRYASPATERVIGAAIWDERPWGLLDIVHPDDMDAARAAFNTDDSAPHALRLRVRDRDGSWRVFDGHVRDHRRDPRIAGYVMNGLDRSREVRLAEGLRVAEPFEALGIMAGGLSHDLNNVLTVVASHAELLEGDTVLDQRARADIAAIRGASDRAQALTRGLLTLSRRKSAAWSVVSLADLARSAVDTRTPIALDVDVQGGHFVRADADAMRQLVRAIVDEGTAEAGAAPVQARIASRDLDEATAKPLRLEVGHYVTFAVGGATEGVVDLVSEVVRTEEGGHWDLAPSDLALLMALAAAREAGGTVVREQHPGCTCLVAYLPAVTQ